MLDKKDYAILQALDKDVRASASQIGRETRLHKDVVSYRMKKLEERGILTGYWAIVQMGPSYSLHKLLIKNKSLSSDEQKKLVAFLLEQPEVAWCADTEGAYDYIISIVTENPQRFAQFTAMLLERFGTHFRERHLLRSTSAVATNEKYLYPDGALAYRHTMDLLKSVFTLDEIDSVLIKQLSLNSRTPYTELARIVNLTPEAVSQRVKNLFASNHIVCYKIRVAVEKLDLTYYHVFITLQNQNKREDIAQYYVAHPRCLIVMHHLGYYDMHLEFVLPSTEIQAVMDDLRTRFGDAIASYELLHIRKEYTMHLLQ